MMGLRPHRGWIALLGLALAIGFGHGPLIGMAQEKQKAELTDLQNRAATAEKKLSQLRDDIAATEKLKTEIGAAEADKSLAPVDRLRVAQLLERRAKEARLDHFSYSFSPEKKTPIDTVAAGRQELAESDVTFTADAPTDSDGVIFIEAARRIMPGRFALRDLSFERIGAADAPLAAANLHMEAKGEWLSNGAAQNPAEQSP